ncbi:unnamed protein product [Lota lota]
MKISVFVLSVVMVCVIGVHADVQPQRDFNLQRFAGRWYRVGLAYDSPGFLRHKDELRITAGMIALQPNGTVNLTMWAMRSSGCFNTLYQYERTNTPGHYTYFSTRHNKTKDITVVETNYTEYALVLKNKKFEREYTQVALYGRTQKVRQDIIQKFKRFSTSRGFPTDSIVTPHVSEFNADVDSYVVHTNYDEYAMWVILSTEQPSGIQSTLVKLYSRAMDVREGVLTQYRALVRNQGMSDDIIIYKDNKGECDQISTASPV